MPKVKVCFVLMLGVGIMIVSTPRLCAEEKGFISIKGADFQLGGELEFEFVDTATDGENTDPHFQLDKVVLQPKVKIGDDIKLDAQIYVQESKAYINEVHAKLTGFSPDCWLDVGLYERWIKSQHGRKTEGYSLLGTSFYRDDASTVTWGGELGVFYWMLSAGNGYEIDAKQVAEDGASVSKIIHDNHATSGLSDSLEYGINLGVKGDRGEGKVDLLAFYYVDELSSSDITSLQGNLPGYTSNDDDKTRIGLGVKYKVGGATLYGAYIDAEDGDLGRDSWVAEASYHIKFNTDREWFTGIEPVISYSDYDVKNTKAEDSPWSWDREKWIFAAIVDFYKNTKLKIEYYVNDETGGSEVSNDEVLVQLEVKF